MRLPLFNQLLLTPLAFQIQRLNWIQSREKELLEGEAPSQGMYGLKGGMEVARKNMEVTQHSHGDSQHAALDPAVLGSSGTRWLLVLPTRIQLIPSSKAQSQHSQS